MSFKKFLAIVAILLIPGIVFAAVGTNANKSDTPGFRQDPGTGAQPVQGGLQTDPPKTFRMVRFVQTNTTNNAHLVTAETIVIWHTASEDDGVTVTVSTLSQDSRVAGILATNALTQETIGNTVAQDRGLRNWTWLQTYGKAQVTIGSGAKAALGGLMGCAGNSSYEGTAGSVQLTVDPGLTGTELGGSGDGNAGTTQFGVAGFFMDSGTAGATDVDVFIRTE